MSFFNCKAQLDLFYLKSADTSMLKNDKILHFSAIKSTILNSFLDKHALMEEDIPFIYYLMDSLNINKIKLKDEFGLTDSTQPTYFTFYEIHFESNNFDTSKYFKLHYPYLASEFKYMFYNKKFISAIESYYDEYKIFRLCGYNIDDSKRIADEIYSSNNVNFKVRKHLEKAYRKGKLLKELGIECR